MKNLRGLSIASLNVCSLTRKFDSIRLLIQTSEIDIFCLNETYLNHSISHEELHNSGYSFVRADRTDAAGKHDGGEVLVYYNSRYEVKLYENGVNCSSHVDTAWMSIKLKNTRDIMLCSLYRPPDGNIDSCLREIADQVEDIGVPQNEDITLIGDCNVNLLNNNATKRNFVNAMKNMNLTQLIDKPTHITANTERLIDHVWTNNAEPFAPHGAIDLGLSDHAMIFLSRKRAKISKAKHKIFVRNYPTFNPDAFTADVANMDWSYLEECDDVDLPAIYFTEKLVALMNKHLPWKTIHISINTAPWITSEFLSLIDYREFRARKCRQNLSAENFQLKN